MLLFRNQQQKRHGTKWIQISGNLQVFLHTVTYNFTHSLQIGITLLTCRKIKAWAEIRQASVGLHRAEGHTTLGAATSQPSPPPSNSRGQFRVLVFWPNKSKFVLNQLVRSPVEKLHSLLLLPAIMNEYIMRIGSHRRASAHK